MTVAADDDRAQRWFVLGAWCVASALLVGYVLLYGRNVPYMEDWELVPTLTGEQPFGLAWLTQQTLEHRYVLARALLYPLWLATGDFRTPMLLDVVLLAATAWLCIRAARIVRGRAAYADAFFPFALLHFGHHESLIFFVQTYFILPVCLELAALALIATNRWRRPGGAVALAACTALLPLNGAIGLLWAAPLAAWSLVAAWDCRRHGAAAWAVPLLAALAAAAFTALYFVGYERALTPVLHPRTPAGVAATTLEVLGIALGPAAAALWPVPGIALALFLAGTGGWLAIVALRNAGERPRALGLGAVLAGGVLVALAIGWGRSVLGPGMGAMSRYALLLVPALAAGWFALLRYGGRTGSALGPMLLCVAACAMLCLNAMSGIVYGRWRSAAADGLLAQVRAGVPPRAIGQRYAPMLYPKPDGIAKHLEALRRAQAGPYRNAGAASLRPDPPCRETAAAYTLVERNEMRDDGADLHGLGTDPYLVFALDAPRRVCGVRLHYRLDTDAGTPAQSQLFWADGSAGEVFDGAQRNLNWTSGTGDLDTTVWIFGRIDRFRFDPHNAACRVRVERVTLLVEGE